jgi:hypothetical protein
MQKFEKDYSPDRAIVTFGLEFFVMEVVLCTVGCLTACYLLTPGALPSQKQNLLP